MIVAAAPYKWHPVESGFTPSITEDTGTLVSIFASTDVLLGLISRNVLLLSRDIPIVSKHEHVPVCNIFLNARVLLTRAFQVAKNRSKRATLSKIWRKTWALLTIVVRLIFDASSWGLKNWPHNGASPWWADPDAGQIFHSAARCVELLPRVDRCHTIRHWATARVHFSKKPISIKIARFCSDIYCYVPKQTRLCPVSCARIEV